jgi:hypothetical protein
MTIGNKEIGNWGQDNWKLLSITVDEGEKLVNETYVLEISAVGCVMKSVVKNKVGKSTHVSESLTFIPDVKIKTVVVDGKAVNRELVKYKTYRNA